MRNVFQSLLIQGVIIFRLRGEVAHLAIKSHFRKHFALGESAKVEACYVCFMYVLCYT